MTTAAAFLFAAVISLTGIVYLLLTDAKRRRVLGLQRAARLPRHGGLGWAVVLLPGLALLVSGQTSALLIWFGSISVGAWLIVSRQGFRP